MKVVDRFKRRILDLAIRGKLVPQDPNDEPASELLARIRAEKAKDERGGRGRKGKRSAVGSDGAAYEKSEQGDLYHTQRHEVGGAQSSAPTDTPFELPNGWAWVSVDDVTELKRGKYITRSRIRAGEIPVILGGQEPAYYCDESNHDGPCVVVSRSGASAGYASYWDSPIFVTDGFLFECHSSSCETRYFFYWLRSLPLDRLQRGTGIPHVRSKDIKALSFPLPPLAEQKRIVARIEELFEIADSLDKAADELAEAAKRLDRKILDLAIRGKLVPQDPTGEPASELLKRIAAASHKSPCKKQSELIHPPFAIPQSWEWVRLGAICEILDSKRKPVAKSKRKPGPYPYYGATCIQDFVSDFIFDEPLVLLGEDGAKWGKGDKSAFCVDGKIWVNNHAHVLRPCDGINHIYLVCTLDILDLMPYVTGTTVPKLNQEKMCDIQIPLPPLAEQKRIVAKIEELRAVIKPLTM